MDEIQRSSIYIITDNYKIKGYGIVYKKHDYYYLDKLWIEHSQKNKNYGKNIMKYLLEIYNNNLIWRTGEEKNKNWYCMLEGVRVVAYNGRYYYLTNTNNKLWKDDIITTLNKDTSFISSPV
jgi:hypothetical protein